MNQPFKSEHRKDVDGNPAGGDSTATGIVIAWQEGPLGRGEDRKEPNGAFVETVIAIVIDRIRHYQSGTKFWCQENANALRHLELALEELQHRTSRRERAGDEGTHRGS